MKGEAPSLKKEAMPRKTQAGFSAREAVGRDVDAVLWRVDACNFSIVPDAQEEGLCCSSNGEEIVCFYF